jgi:hypothetical protein
MRIKLTNTWKTKVDVEVPGPGVDEVIAGHFVAEFRDLPISRIKAMDKDRRRLQRQLKAAKEGNCPEDELVAIEDEAANADRAMLDTILVLVHGLELESEDGRMLTPAETTEYVKDHADFALPVIQAFTGRLGKVAEKNSVTSGTR